MRVQIDPHTLERAEERGASRAEIEEVVLTGVAVPAKRDRVARAKVFLFGTQWRGIYYEQKLVKVVYLMKEDVATTVTVYVFYGKWEV